MSAPIQQLPLHIALPISQILCLTMDAGNTDIDRQANMES
jgi:hypothetical protein